MIHSRLLTKAGVRRLTKSFIFLVLISCAGVSLAAPAIITGVAFGSVTEDIDPDGDNLLEVGGKLSVADPDAGEAFFKPSVHRGSYGHLYINSWGNWSYAANNGQAAIQNLSYGQSLREIMSVSSLDGTRRNVIIVIRGADESNEVANTPAVIGGVASGSVTKDADPDGDNMLEISGLLTVVDPDAGEAYFRPSLYTGSFGVLYLNSLGNWIYAAQNDLAAIQNLTAANSLKDTIAISTMDGTRHNVVITIMGADGGGVESGDISVSWTAPVEREDGSAISMSEIAGYRVYYGLSHGDYNNEVVIDSSSTMNVTLRNLSSGTYYIVVTTVDRDGRESNFSREVVRNI